jgi:hypothetical protein
LIETFRKRFNKTSATSPMIYFLVAFLICQDK